MGLLDKIKGSKEKTESTTMVETPACPHVVLIARWDNIDDIGKEDRATSFFCEACSQTFTPAEADEMRDAAQEKLIAITTTEEQVP